MIGLQQLAQADLGLAQGRLECCLSSEHRLGGACLLATHSYLPLWDAVWPAAVGALKGGSWGCCAGVTGATRGGGLLGLGGGSRTIYRGGKGEV